MLKWGIQEWYNEMVLIIEYYRTERCAVADNF